MYFPAWTCDTASNDKMEPRFPTGIIDISTSVSILLSFNNHSNEIGKSPSFMAQTTCIDSPVFKAASDSSNGFICGGTEIYTISQCNNDGDNLRFP